MSTAAEKSLEANAIRRATAIQHRMNAAHAICDSCGKPAFWAKTERGKSILMDYEVHSNGNYELKPLLNDRLLARRVSLQDLKVLPSATPLYNSHWDKCPAKKAAS